MIKLVKAKGEFEECKWVVNLLESKFFGTCIDHQSQRKNEKNMFCIDCKLCFCKHCVAGAKTRCHQHHRRLQICRYVYHDVVRLQEIQKHFDCSNIQTYKINGEKAVHLNPRPHQHKEMKQAKLKMHGTYCEACERHIQDVPNRFCSIACKVSVAVMEDLDKQECCEMMAFSFYKETFDFKGLPNENESSFSSSLDSVEENIQASPWLTSKTKAKKSVVHKRKGIPRRAPLC
ncbi:PLATZ transcription factor family protein [Artemisia annua]|uniref:PLATZ transcription factor family protein n=1 Tax=Artemisia annua TaxID=35608 RepID=A0A2U1NTE5_ARTAN|nr:PLATZ transcription factor family protein [Artemisia annua]